MIDGSPAAERGAALGAYTSFWDLGLGAAGLVAGPAVGIDYAAPFLLAAAAALLRVGTGTPAGRRVAAQRT